MTRRIFLMMLLLSVILVSRAWASDCSRFISDFKEGLGGSSKAYQFESKQLYIPSEYCSFPPLSYVANQSNRVEFYLVEQCRETSYKILKTTLMCFQDSKAAKVRSICDVNGQLLAPCLKSELAALLAQTEPS